MKPSAKRRRPAGPAGPARPEGPPRSLRSTVEERFICGERFELVMEQARGPRAPLRRTVYADCDTQMYSDILFWLSAGGFDREHSVQSLVWLMDADYVSVSGTAVAREDVIDDIQGTILRRTHDVQMYTRLMGQFVLGKGDCVRILVDPRLAAFREDAVLEEVAVTDESRFLIGLYRAKADDIGPYVDLMTGPKGPIEASMELTLSIEQLAGTFSGDKAEAVRRALRLS